MESFNTGYFLAAVGAAAAVTFALRLIPFGLKRVLGNSAFLAKARIWMPLGAIVILCIYGMTGISFSGPSHGIPELAGIVVTVGMHLWRRNALLSMVAGTGVCLILANLVFH